MGDIMTLKDVFEYEGDKIPKDLDNDPRVVKVNIPGEGIWAYLRNPEDIEKYNKGDPNETFDVILLNNSVSYFGVLKWGFVIKVRGTGLDTRPMLDKDWINEKINQLYNET
jgi:hypothetical protein